MLDLDLNASVDDAIAKLRRDGIAVMRGYINRTMVEELRNEFERAFETDDSAIYSKHYHPTSGRVARAHTNKLSASDFGRTRSVFLSSYFEQVASAYYEPHLYRLNDDVFFSHELPSDEPILPWHFDRKQSLKFFIYLTDTTKENGAFEYCPGTHNEGHYRANYYKLKGVRERDIPNDIPEEEIRNPVSVEGEAGDLIIFDPDGFHRGGVVQEGHERKVIRGHAHPVAAPAGGRFSVERWMSGLFRAMRPLAGRLERRLGDQVRSGAARTRSDGHVQLSTSRGEQQ